MSEQEDFEKWLEKKNNKKKKEGTYRERVLSGEQKSWKDSSKKKSKLSRKSNKESSRQSKYRKASKEYLEDHPRCELCGNPSSLSIHHKMGRSGEYLWDKSFFMTLCLLGYAMDRAYPDSNHSHTGGCHGWVEANKRLARELKLILY